MAQHENAGSSTYPTGRGYGHDYMRGGEIFGGYGYSSRPEYTRRRGETAETIGNHNARRAPAADDRTAAPPRD